MNIELRWLDREARMTGNKVDWVPYRERVLQYRTRDEHVVEGELVSWGPWYDWRDVPVEAE